MELKQCPFCGEKAKLQSHPFEFWVKCSECGASTMKYFKSRETAAEAWNKRADA